MILLLFLIIYFLGFGTMVYRLGWPMRGSILVVIIWALVVTFWPITLPINIFYDLRHRL